MKTKYLFLFAFLAILAACSDSITDGDKSQSDRINLSGDIEQMTVTRVNDNGFTDGDNIGVYIVDYKGNEPGTLTDKGNHADNVRYTFDGGHGRWVPAFEQYWNDKHTHIDLYGYYPYGEPDDVNDYKFEVRRDQSVPTGNGEMGGYEASDFLWGKVADVAPTSSTIRLPMRHRMACARVTLTQGDGFENGEWNATDKSVLVANVVRKASINMADGSVKPDGEVESTATIPSKTNNEWRAIVVPQTVAGGATLFAITVGGQPFRFSRSDGFTYQPGMMNNFTIRVDKKMPEGKYALTLVSESITPWENDLVSHDATAREYVVINSTAGHLKDCIAAAKKDYRKLKNLKITGTLNNTDFEFMRNDMSSLQALNMKDARIVRETTKNGTPLSENDALPNKAFFQKVTLAHVILPDVLKKIDVDAFFGCSSLSGSVIIPEGVTKIGEMAFANCSSLTNVLPFPSTLKTIDDMAFYECTGLSGQLILPNKLETINGGAFDMCAGLYGEIRFPETLKEIGEEAFNGCSGLTGNLIIPKSVSVINQYAFRFCGFDGTLTLHDGITQIYGEAFRACHFKGELHLPKDLKIVNQLAFADNNFSGRLVLPTGLLQIGESAFEGNRFTGTLEFPDGMESVSVNAFSNCSFIEKLVFPENLSVIRENAFNGCSSVGSIVCKGDIPAKVYGGAFDGVAKDNFAVEVPEQSVAQYKTTSGWRDFKRIAAHHELVCRPSATCALNNEHKQTLTLDAEGDWEVESKPSWCEVSPMSGSKKTEVTLTINTLAKGAANRSGKVVFKLKDKEYTSSCDVSQYNYEYGENEWLTLQKASRGSNGGINIVLLGDGFDANAIANGSYLRAIKQEMEYFFAIEPYKTYRQYFNVYTAIPLSTEEGVGTVNTVCRNKFNTTFTEGVGLQADYDDIFSYCLNAPTVTKNNLSETLIIMIPNSTDYGGITQMWQDGSAISFCPMSNEAYPLDSRGVIQHEAGGHGFGKLADEYIYHNAFIDACGCSCCQHDDAVRTAKSYGWYDNISLSGKSNAVPWSHLIFDKRYSDIVDIFEGAFMHSRGVFRSEQNSCMNNDIPYYSTISRESIVKRIKRYAGEKFSFEDFVANDRGGAAQAKTRAYSGTTSHSVGSSQMPPVIHQGSPLKMRKVRRHK